MNVILMVNDHNDIERNYKFNISKKPISNPKLLRLVNEVYQYLCREIKNSSSLH